MLEPTETNPKVQIEPGEMAESDELDKLDNLPEYVELDEETTPTRGFTMPSATLLFALFLLTTSIGISLSAGFFLWSLSDHPVNPEASTAAQSDS